MTYGKHNDAPTLGAGKQEPLLNGSVFTVTFHTKCWFICIKSFVCLLKRTRHVMPITLLRFDWYFAKNKINNAPKTDARRAKQHQHNCTPWKVWTAYTNALHVVECGQVCLVVVVFGRLQPLDGFFHQHVLPAQSLHLGNLVVHTKQKSKLHLKVWMTTELYLTNY